MTKTAKLLLLCLCLGCTQKHESVELLPGTPDHELAAELAKKLPYLDPDANNIWVSCRDFDVRTGDILQLMRENYGDKVNLMKRLGAEKLKKAFTETAKDLGVKKLMLYRALALNLTAEEQEIDRQMANVIVDNGGEDEFRALLEGNGRSVEDIRTDVRNRILGDRYLAHAMADRVKVTEEEILEAYREEKYAEVRQLLIAAPTTNAEREKNYRKISELRKRAIEGEDFVSLIREYSDDKAAKHNDGHFRVVRGEERLRSLQDAIFSLPIGEISEVVKTDLGYHIFQVTKRYSEPLPLANVRASIEAHLARQKQSAAYQGIIDELMREGQYQLQVPWPDEGPPNSFMR